MLKKTLIILSLFVLLEHAEIFGQAFSPMLPEGGAGGGNFNPQVKRVGQGRTSPPMGFLESGMPTPPSQDFGRPGPSQGKEVRGDFETTGAPLRAIYLNGENISSVKNQELENVSIAIDDRGNLHISAPQYEIKTERYFHPLLPSELPSFSKQDSTKQAHSNR